MRLSVLVLSISLVCSNASAMWWPGAKPTPKASGQLREKIEIVAMIAVGIYMLISDHGVIATLFENPRRFSRDDED